VRARPDVRGSFRCYTRQVPNGIATLPAGSVLKEPEPDGEIPEFRHGRTTEPLELPVLVVNRVFQPVQITTARRAFLLLFGGAALAIDDAGELHDFSAWRRLPVRDKDDGLPVVGGSLRVPRVLHLRRYDRMRRTTIRLTRKNVMLRDAHQCQYCARRPPVRDLNIDHVLPRSRGGQDSWENLVTAEASMRLIRQPLAPRWSATMQILIGLSHPFDEWGPFLKAG
jgi:hypothetical protein